MEKYGIKETKEALALVLPMLMGVEAAVAKDLTGGLSHLVKAGVAAPAAIADISLVPKEYADFDEAEKAELKAFVEGELDLKNDKLEMMIETALKVVVELSVAVKLLKEVKAA